MGQAMNAGLRLRNLPGLIPHMGFIFIIISSVLSGNAEKFVAGDKELLELGIVKSMQIVSPRMFWEALKTQSLAFFQLGL